MRYRLQVLNWLALGAVLLRNTLPAHATFPGKNGRIALIPQVKRRFCMRTLPERLVYILVTLVAISLPLQSSAQNHPTHKQHHQRYRLFDLGPGSGIGSGITVANDQGDVVGGALTSILNPYVLNPNPLFGPAEFTQNAFRWRNGKLKDLGTLPGGYNSAAGAVNESGTIVGLSEDGVIDPLTGYPEAFGVLWSHGRIHNLGALGGNQSFAVAINNRGQVTGLAENDVPDPFSLLGGTEAHAFLWERGVMRDLGTLGGPDSWGFYVNEEGQVAGFSFTSDLSFHPFLWNKGQMFDLGSFGGTFGFANALNNRGQVAGFMNLPGDVNAHPFLWDRGTLVDLGTLGGENAEADGMNDASEVVGEADDSIPCTPDCDHPQVYRPFLWRHGIMTDLGAVPGDRCGNAYAINARTQVVGADGHCHGFVDAFLWERGSIYNLNDLVAGPAPLHLVVALFITDDGLIAGTGVPPGVSVYDETLTHVFVLVPCGDRCEEDDAETTSAESKVREEWLATTAANTAAKQQGGGMRDRIRQLFAHRCSR
jgi:probable HAF family extracellular repeat protein